MLTLGSRRSPLALAQVHRVQSMLMALTGLEAGAFPIVTFTTTGDQIQDRRLQDAGGKGLFTKELDEALLDGRIDAAVHSLKDVPTRLAPGLVMAAIPEREDVRDAFVCRNADGLMSLAVGATVGTASLRRQAQTLYLRPDLKVVTLRGSVQTRLDKIEQGMIDATYLAAAGLARLGLSAHARAFMPEDLMPPAAGQGALAIVARENSGLDVLARLDMREHALAITAERAFLEALDGSCRTPIAAHARLAGDRMLFVGEALTTDGRERWRREADVTVRDAAAAHALGYDLGRDIASEAGDRLSSAVTGW